MTQPSEWVCGFCGKPAQDKHVEEQHDDGGVGVTYPICQNPSCPYNGSIIPNYIH